MRLYGGDKILERQIQMPRTNKIHDFHSAVAAHACMIYLRAETFLSNYVPVVICVPFDQKTLNSSYPICIPVRTIIIVITVTVNRVRE